jgi:hypothetical protein
VKVLIIIANHDHLYNDSYHQSLFRITRRESQVPPQSLKFKVKADSNENSLDCDESYNFPSKG